MRRRREVRPMHLLPPDSEGPTPRVLLGKSEAKAGQGGGGSAPRLDWPVADGADGLETGYPRGMR